jgi:hypothetical protein
LIAPRASAGAGKLLALKGAHPTADVVHDARLPD